MLIFGEGGREKEGEGGGACFIVEFLGLV
jgi:hypothetical protein